MPIVDKSKQNKGINNTQNKQIAIDIEYQISYKTLIIVRTPWLYR